MAEHFVLPFPFSLSRVHTDSRLSAASHLLIVVSRLIIFSTNEMRGLLVVVGQEKSAADGDERPMAQVAGQAVLVEDAVLVHPQVTLVFDGQSARHAVVVAENERVRADDVVVDERRRSQLRKRTRVRGKTRRRGIGVPRAGR